MRNIASVIEPTMRPASSRAISSVDDSLCTMRSSAAASGAGLERDSWGMRWAKASTSWSSTTVATEIVITALLDRSSSTIDRGRVASRVASATVLLVTTPDDPAPFVRRSSSPELRSPVLICAFEGWNDAGDAASTTTHHLIERWHAEKFADIDPEEFFDFTSLRPTVEIVDGFDRELHWPDNSFYAARLPDAPFDAIVLHGMEPQMKWRTFCEQILATARAFGAEMVVTMGALLADVPHTRPVQVLGTAYDEPTANKLGLEPSNYEGPTGILGVLHTAAREAGFTVASLWAAVPAYIPGAPSPKAALALVDRLTLMLDVSVYTTDLEIASVAYERQVSELVSEDEETMEFVAELEERYDSEERFASGESLVDEVEQFLRDQRSD